MLPPDNHLHSQWSWDTGATASMEGSCERAVALGLPSVAFTEHLDFTRWAPGDAGDPQLLEGHRPRAQPIDVEGYLECVQRCRERFPSLRVVSGVEAGEPHLLGASVAAVLARGRFDRVLGSLHAVPDGGRLVDVGALLASTDPREVVRRYFAELVRLVGGSDLFEVLAHVDFPRRYWPGGRGYAEADYEEEYRAVFRALAGSGRVLELNTRTPMASSTLLRWWYDEGGRALSFGSDAHVPSGVGTLFDVAAAVAEDAGFRPGRDPLDFWRR